LLFVLFKLTIVEENFPVSVSDDYVTNLLDIERRLQPRLGEAALAALAAVSSR
jgi:hypothetical protein